MEDYLEKATTLVEAMPYIKEFAGAVVVIKYGGEIGRASCRERV